MGPKSQNGNRMAVIPFSRVSSLQPKLIPASHKDGIAIPTLKNTPTNQSGIYLGILVRMNRWIMTLTISISKNPIMTSSKEFDFIRVRIHEITRQIGIEIVIPSSDRMLFVLLLFIFLLIQLTPALHVVLAYNGKTMSSRNQHGRRLLGRVLWSRWQSFH